MDTAGYTPPANAEQRRRMASKAPRAKPNREIKDLKDQLATLTDDVLVDRGEGAVVNQIINTRARLVEIERKVRETEQLEERIAQLEQNAEGQKWGRAKPWRA